MKKDFNDFRFSGLGYRELSNKYYTMSRISEDGNKIVVRVGDNHLLKTKFGFALVLDQTHVVFLKDWQVNQNYFGNEVLLSKEFWNVKEWGNHDAFMDTNVDLHDFNYWFNAAKEQDLAIDEDGFKKTQVRWSK